MARFLLSSRYNTDATGDGDGWREYAGKVGVAAIHRERRAESSVAGLSAGLMA